MEPNTLVFDNEGVRVAVNLGPQDELRHAKQ
jgi:hypothetical protein